MIMKIMPLHWGARMRTRIFADADADADDVLLLLLLYKIEAAALVCCFGSGKAARSGLLLVLWLLYNCPRQLAQHPAPCSMPMFQSLLQCLSPRLVLMCWQRVQLQLQVALNGNRFALHAGILAYCSAVKNDVNKFQRKQFG